MTSILPMRTTPLVLAALLTGIFAAGTVQARDPNEKYPRTCAERKREAELMRLLGGSVENASERKRGEAALFGKPAPAKPREGIDGKKETH